LNKLLVVTLLAFVCVTSYADDLKVADDFKSGDLVSADTFNQIFDTIEKINRTVVDSDLVGVWKCSAVHASSNNYNGWINKGVIYELTDAQVNFTASSATTSLESAYSYSTSSPTPFFRSSDPAEAGTGTYQFYKGLLVLKNAATSKRGVATMPWKLDVVSDTRIILEKKNASGNTPELVLCDSAEAVPASPTSPSATNNKTGINLAWTDSSSDETGFKVYRKLSTETEAKVIATQTAVTYSDTDLTEGQTAYYHVTAYNDNGDSAKSKIVSATLDGTPPTILSVSPSDGSTLGWDMQVTIQFSEKVVTCTDENCFPLTLTLNGVTRTELSVTYGTFETLTVATSAFAGEKGIYTMTISANGIKDESGNIMVADYSWSFTNQ
jgi:hypothetical protein